MPTDPFVASDPELAPRHRQNLPPGIAVPPARSWEPSRPGDATATGQPEGELLGRPGPNVGYALTIVKRVESSWHLAEGEFVDDAAAVVAEIAMKRAAHFGRAPVKYDIELAVALLGYDRIHDTTWAKQRQLLTLGAEHHYEARRRIVDSVGDDLLKSLAEQASGAAPAWRATLVAH